MNNYKKVQIWLLIILLIAIVTFCYLIFTWNFAYSSGVLITEDGTYTGEFKGKVFNGQGFFESVIGAKYEGQWKNGEMEGYGVMTFVNRSKYEGEFKDGLYNGKGKMTQPDGKVIEGIWESGKLKAK